MKKHKNSLDRYYKMYKIIRPYTDIRLKKVELKKQGNKTLVTKYFNQLSEHLVSNLETLEKTKFVSKSFFNKKHKKNDIVLQSLFIMGYRLRYLKRLTHIPAKYPTPNENDSIRLFFRKNYIMMKQPASKTYITPLIPNNVVADLKREFYRGAKLLPPTKNSELVYGYCSKIIIRPGRDSDIAEHAYWDLDELIDNIKTLVEKRAYSEERITNLCLTFVF